jgi:hypothetical protein
MVGAYPRVEQLIKDFCYITEAPTKVNYWSVNLVEHLRESVLPFRVESREVLIKEKVQYG